MSTGYLKPTTKGMRAPLDNGSQGDMIVNPPRWAELGGLKNASKISKKRMGMAVKKPGQTEHK